MTKKRVLVIDDEPELREVISDILDFLNLDIKLASDGQEAIDCLQKYAFDLIISDLKMPKKSGFDVVQWMRAHDDLTPFILQTGHGHKQVRDDALQYGVLAVLDKPWDQEELLTLVKKALQI